MTEAPVGTRDGSSRLATYETEPQNSAQPTSLIEATPTYRASGLVHGSIRQPARSVPHCATPPDRAIVWKRSTDPPKSGIARVGSAPSTCSVRACRSALRSPGWLFPRVGQDQHARDHADPSDRSGDRPAW